MGFHNCWEGRGSLNSKNQAERESGRGRERKGRKWAGRREQAWGRCPV